MRSLEEVRGERLRWTRRGFLSREHQLELGDESLATLRFVGLGSRAEAECSLGRWRIEREHWFGRDVRIVEVGSEREIARFDGRWFGRGTLELGGDERFEWRWLNPWRTRWGFVRENGDPVLWLQEHLSPLRARADLTIEPERIAPLSLAVMALLARYLGVQRRRSRPAD